MVVPTRPHERNNQHLCNRRIHKRCPHVVTCLHNRQLHFLLLRRNRAPCGVRGCKNRAHSVSWPEVVKAVPNQGLDCFVSWGSFFHFSFVFLLYVVLCLIVFGCQYQCNWLPGKTRLRNDLLCVEWDAKPYTLTHSLEEIAWLFQDTKTFSRTLQNTLQCTCATEPVVYGIIHGQHSWPSGL